MLLRTAGWARIRDESHPGTNARQCGGTIALADMSIKMTPPWRACGLCRQDDLSPQAAVAGCAADRACRYRGRTSPEESHSPCLRSWRINAWLASGGGSRIAALKA